MNRQQRYAQARAELGEFVAQGGKKPAKALRRIEILRADDPDIHAACEQAIRGGSIDYAVEMLERLEHETPSVTDDDVDAVAGAKAARVLSWVSGAAWAGVAAVCWLAYPGVGPSIALLVGAWALSIVALAVGGSVAAKLYEHYSSAGELLGALVFLAVPLTLPIGVIWTIVRALRIRGGTVDGPGHDPHPGGGYGRFDEGDIGPAGRPIARAAVLLALGHAAALAGVILRSGVIETIASQ